MKNNNFPPVSLVIPTYQGLDLLKEFLPANYELVNKYPGGAELILVDDGSSDSSQEWLRGNYPKIKLVEMKKNKGFGAACNAGVAAAQNSIVFLVNNDMELTDKTFVKAVPHFHDESLFGLRLGLQMQIMKGQSYEMNRFWIGLGFKRGFLDLPMLKRTDFEGACEIPILSGGAAAFRRDLFLKSGGFDELFLPFYWEDIDLSLRAWRSGWRILYEPEAVCYHKGRGTTHRLYSEKKIQKISERNRYLLTWKHCSGFSMWIRHILFTLCRLFFNTVTLKWNMVSAFFNALSQAGKVRKKRALLNKNTPIKLPFLLKKWRNQLDAYPLFFGSTNTS